MPENATAIAGQMLTTETLVHETREDDKKTAAGTSERRVGPGGRTGRHLINELVQTEDARLGL